MQQELAHLATLIDTIFIFEISMRKLAAEISVSGAKADYSLQLLTGADGVAYLALIGSSPRTAGQSFSLQGKQFIKFADGELDLSQTIYGIGHGAHSLPMSAAAPSVHSAITQWFESFQDTEEMDTGASGRSESARLKTWSPEAPSPHAVYREVADLDYRDALINPPLASVPFPGTQADLPRGGPDMPPELRLPTESNRLPGFSATDTSNPMAGYLSSRQSIDKVSPSPPVDPKLLMPMRLFGTPADDLLKGGFADDVFYTSAGSDVYVGNAGVDTLVGVDINTAYAVQIAPGVFQLRGDVSLITEGADGKPVYGEIISGTSAILTGVELFKSTETDAATRLAQIARPSDFADELAPLNPELRWTIDGKNGDDRITGGKNGDQLSGGEGNDLIDGGPNDLSVTSSGEESLFGGAGNDRLTFTLSGASPANQADRWRVILDGGAGDDQINAMLSPFAMISVDGGSGADRLMIELSSTSSSPFDPGVLKWRFEIDDRGFPLLKAHYPDGQPGFAISEISPSIEYLGVGFTSMNVFSIVRPDAGRTVLTGGPAAEIFFPTAGLIHDVSAGAGNDLVIAGGGSTVSLGAGFNTLYTDGPDVSLSYSDAPAAVRANLARKLGMVIDDAGEVWSVDRLLGSVSRLVGSAYDDHLTGSTQAEALIGGAGNDIIDGGGGDDELFGGAGDDLLIFSGQGRGSMTGGSGKDQFVINIEFNKDSLVRITDFSVDDDLLKINLSAFSEASGETIGRVDWRDASNNSIIKTNTVGPGDAHLIFDFSYDMNGIFIFNTGQFPPFLQLDIHESSMTPEQLIALINVDYFG